ncbi:MAG: energy-coupling factor transporter transmembrane protein EcfT [Gammaproteobacteria bacterium]|nr:energy-coupling factor transporter transmembrane protein EcfT [Gammaproteobacteria bacterium]
MNIYPLHPLVRIAGLLVFIAGMALAQPLVLMGGTFGLLLAYAMAGFPAPGGLLSMVVRLRWLLVAILLVYGWWTPGELLWPALGAVSPTLQGLGYGLARIFALLCIVSAVHFLLQVTERGQLVSALMQLGAPFLGPLARERFAVRVLLTLEAVVPVQAIVSDALQQKNQQQRGLSRLVFHANAVYSSVLAQADKSAGAVIDVAEPDAPPAVQWLFPLLLAVLIGFLAGR